MTNWTRRVVLQRAMQLSALGAATPLAINLAAIGEAAAFDASGYKALVCIFLHGGNDSFNMLVPNTTAEYNVYAASRQNMAIAQQDLLPINPVSVGGSNPFGLHPSMTGLQGLFETGKASFVANVGPLVEPTTRDQYFAGSVTVPSQLFSHNDQQDQWHSLKGAGMSKTGWAGRMYSLVDVSSTR